MLRNFFKVFFFTSLVVTALITVLTTLHGTRHIFAHMLAEIAYVERGEISTAVAAFFPVTITVLCMLLALLVCVALHFIQKKKATTATSSNAKFFLYYFIALVVVSLLVLFFCWNRFQLLERCINVAHVVVFALLYGACVVEALVLSALTMSFFTLWKTNKLVASIIGVIIILIIPANVISGEAVKEASTYSSSNNNTWRHAHGSPPYDSYIEEEDIYNEPIEVVEDYLAFLWEEEEDIDNALDYLFRDKLSSWDNDYAQHFLFDIMNLAYMLNATNEEWGSSDDEKLPGNTLRKIYRYLTKNPAEILNAFYSYQGAIYQHIPAQGFYATGADALLQQLIAAHNDLYSSEDLSRLQNIYKLMANIKHDWVTDYYNDIKLHIDESYLSIFYDKDGDFYQGGAVWAYSFWARRNAEGTDDIAYSILSLLSQYYIEDYRQE